MNKPIKLTAYFFLAPYITLSMFISTSTNACSQTDMDEISLTSKSMKQLVSSHSKCASIGTNAARSQCWSRAPLSDEDHKKYTEIESKYYSLLSTCEWDSIKYNLSNFRQAFGFECDAFDSFVEIKEPSRFESLNRIMAESALQCAINSKETQLFNEKKAQLGEFISITVKRNAESSNRTNTGRLLAVWRDYFALGSPSNDSLTIARSITNSDNEWASWTSFLEPLRRHLSSWRNSLFPDRHNINSTAKQYELSSTKLAN